jgi:hypothetical protein
MGALMKRHFLMQRISTFCVAAIAGALAGCTTPAQNIALVTTTTVLGAQAPGQEIEQVYYLGIFDPQEQVPEAVYRLTVHGQGSAIGLMRFASGWVPANLVDTLNTNIGFNKDSGAVEVTNKQDASQSSIATGRRLMLFGPEGFREAPKDHRLVIVMGSSPEAFFGAIGDSLQAINQVSLENKNSAASQSLMNERLRLEAERARLQDLKAEIAIELPEPKGGAQ